MKPLPLFLAASLALNAAIAVALVMRDRSSSPPSSSPSSIASPSGSPTPTSSAPRTWQEAGFDKITGAPADDTAFVAALRAQGFPLTVIRAIVRDRVNERFAERRLALENKNPNRNYWQPYDSGYSPASIEYRSASRALSREQEEAIRLVLGEDAQSEYQRTASRRHYGDLPPEKIRALEAIANDYNDLISQTRAGSMGITLPEDREKLAYLEREKQTDLAKLLTPEELAAYELRASPSAGQVKSRLAFFDATETEYLALFGLQKTFDATYGQGATAGPTSAEQNRARAEAQKKLTADIETALGPDRYASYKIATDSSYRQVSQLVARLALPPETTSTVVSLAQDIRQRGDSLRNNSGLNSAQRSAQLGELYTEATTKLTTTLGAEGLAAYRENGGYWLNNLQPRPQPTPPPKP